MPVHILTIVGTPSGPPPPPPPPPFWIRTLNGSSSEQGESVIADNDDNVYIVGYTYSSGGAGSSDMYIAKYNKYAVLQWQYSLGCNDSNSLETFHDVVFDGVDGLYAVGQSPLIAFDSLKPIIAKYTTSGTLVWQKSYDSFPGVDNQFRSIEIDNDGNLIVAGQVATAPSSFAECIVMKCDTSGNIIWQKIIGTNTSSEAGYSVVIDSANNIYVAGMTSATGGAGNFDLLLVKFNTSGAVQWQRSLGISTVDYGYAVAIDPLDNIYVSGYFQTTSDVATKQIILAKYNSSGTILWQRSLGNTSTYSDQGNGLVVHGSNNIYVIGTSSSVGGAGNSDIIVAKYDASGVIQWQRSLGTTTADQGLAVACDSAGALLITGAGTSSNSIIVAKLPADGSMTGTYGPFQYKTRALIETAATLTPNTRTLNVVNGTCVAANSSLTGLVRTLTSLSYE
jgi:uncharacterized delta-60 repeat protein